MLVVLLKKQSITLELLRLILSYQAENKTKNKSIKNELKKLIKNLAFFFRQIYSLVNKMVLKLI